MNSPVTQNMLDSFKCALIEHIRTTYPDFIQIIPSIVITLNDDPKKAHFGDFSTNAALILAPLCKKAPRAVAEELVASFKHPLVASSAIAGPGFINITLSTDAWNETGKTLFSTFEDFFKLPINYKKTSYSIEFVSANPTGPLHLGHGRGGIIGDVVGTILAFLGHPVTKEFYVNDAGKQIKTLGESLKIRCEQALGLATELPEDAYHGGYLIEMAEKLIKEHSVDVKSAIKEHNIEFFARYAKEHLLAEQQETLDRYGIQFNVWFSEKTLHTDGSIERAIKKLEENGYIFTQDGALWFKTTTFGDDKDRVVRRANGELTYIAADLAYMLNKIERGAEKLIFVLGQDHHGYVSRLKGSMAAFGYNPDNLDVILYQLVTIKEDGEVVRLSKRAGRIVSLEGIIDTVGTDVARFFYLNRKPDAHLEFDVTLALQHTEENPVFYIQYAYVRTSSILEKAAEIAELWDISKNDLNGFTAEELLLLRKICALKDLLANISKNYQAHLLTYYVLELAHTFHSFYSTNRVIDSTNILQSRRRLALIIILRNTFGLCLKLLGISSPKNM